MPDMNGNVTQLQVTFVHGTWASRGKWFRRGSGMWRAFEAEGATCHSFVWSGRNSHRARSHAAERLARHLYDLDPGGTGAPLAVVAHSHGGNAAVHAVWRLAPGKYPIKVVTLATPYFFAKRKSRPSTLDTAVSILVFLYMSALLVALLVTDSDTPMGSPTTIPVASVTVAALALQAVAWAFFRFQHGSPSSRAVQERVVVSIQTPPIPEAARQQDLLVIRAADDEAGGLLGTAQFSGWLGFTGARLAKPARLVLVILALVVVLYELGEGYTLMGVETFSLAGHLTDWTFTLFGLLVLLIALPSIAALAHGWDGASTSRFAVVTAEASPPGSATVWQREIRESRANGLAHSSLYEDPAVIARVVSHVTS